MKYLSTKQAHSIFKPKYKAVVFMKLQNNIDSSWRQFNLIRYSLGINFKSWNQSFLYIRVQLLWSSNVKGKCGIWIIFVYFLDHFCLLFGCQCLAFCVIFKFRRKMRHLKNCCLLSHVRGQLIYFLQMSNANALQLEYFCILWDIRV